LNLHGVSFIHAAIHAALEKIYPDASTVCVSLRSGVLFIHQITVYSRSD
jgi:hypothetical protein